ncbi:MAG: hypothetical protein LBB84_13075, partial [Tannerellaceae bacterium]|nr:hypothetical protein [Tannerellaceae bacterium]
MAEKISDRTIEEEMIVVYFRQIPCRPSFYILSNYQFVRFGNEKKPFFAAQPSANLQKRLD